MRYLSPPTCSNRISTRESSGVEPPRPLVLDLAAHVVGNGLAEIESHSVTPPAVSGADPLCPKALELIILLLLGKDLLREVARISIYHIGSVAVEVQHLRYLWQIVPTSSI